LDNPAHSEGPADIGIDRRRDRLLISWDEVLERPLDGSGVRSLTAEPHGFLQQRAVDHKVRAFHVYCAYALVFIGATLRLALTKAVDRDRRGRWVAEIRSAEVLRTALIGV